jgi:NTE family protein
MKNVSVPEEKFRIGLVLSGGGTRGFAHLGVIQALNETGIFPDIISGTSAGALVGALYADGHSPEEILHMMNSGSRLDFHETCPASRRIAADWRSN